MDKNKKLRVVFLLWGFAPLLLAGCDNGPKTAAPGQGVAKVNGEEITIHQVSDELAVLNLDGNSDSEELSMQVIDTLIDQNIAAQKAKKQRLERDPQVMRAVERTKRYILAQAYLDRLVAAAPTPTPLQITEYFTNHPELFSDNKVYFFETLALDKSSVTPVLRAQLEQTESLDKAADWLRLQKIPYTKESSVKPAGQLPFEVLEKIYGAEKGQIFIVHNATESVIYKLLDAAPQPIAEADAAPLIKNFLINAQRQTIVNEEIKRLRASASVEYLGRFAKNKSTDKPAVVAVSGNKSELAAVKSPDVMQKGSAGVNN